MKMTKFRIQNYKKISDTGWINCSSLTAFVGKNESGKSAIFRALSKLNPSDKEEYDGLKEFPRRRYTSEFNKQDWPVASVEFELSKDESSELSEICPPLKDVKTVICTSHYSNTINVEFPEKPDLAVITNRVYLNLIRAWQSLVEQSTAEDKGEQLAVIKRALLQLFTSKIEYLTTQPPDSETPPALVNEVNNGTMSQLTEQWQMELFKPITKQIAELRNSIQIRNQLEQANKWVINYIPQFIYFDRYDVIDSAVHIPTFVQQLQQKTLKPRVRTTKCLFQHVGLDPQVIEQLDPSKPDKVIEQVQRWADERTILMSSASQAMTQKFSEWWEQRRHKFRYNVDGPFFRVWVSDDLDPSDIELDQRSAGMQYFFSFYLVFLVEAQGAHQNSILLLDEPGLHVHGTAQQKVVKFLEKLSEQNQLLYSTHSPFMVDGDHLENVRVVYEDKEDGTTQVSENVWPDDEDSLFPLQAGLGYAIAQTLFYSKRQLVVEGLTDYWFLKSINMLLSSKGMTTLRDDAVIVPAGGVNNLMPLASMLVGHEIKIAVLLDSDEPAVRKGKEFEKNLKLKCLFMDTYTNKEQAEIEDLFPEDFYLSAVKEAYDGFDFDFTPEEKQIQPIAKRVEAAFKRMGIDSFEKWRPARIILDRLQKDDPVLQATYSKFEDIFKDVNKILK